MNKNKLALISVMIFATASCTLPEGGFSQWFEDNINIWTPTVELGRGVKNQSPSIGDEVSLKARAWDLETGLLNPFDFYLDGDLISWRSDKEGDLGTGESLTTNLMTPGMHQITVSATDNDGDGRTGRKTFNLYVLPPEPDPNIAPVATITSPERNGQSFNFGEEVVLEGYGNDPEQGLLTGDHLLWSSDLDGTLGNGERFVVNRLSEGRHTITLHALERTESEIEESGEGGLIGTSSITITIEAAEPPMVSITSPESGFEIMEGTEVTFEGEGTGVNGDELDNDQQLEWNSDIDGLLGRGPSLTVDDLSVGAHLITLTVKAVAPFDELEVTGSTSIFINVTEAPREPVVAMVSPSGGAIFQQSETFELLGTCAEADGAEIDVASQRWLLGELSFEGPGPHAIEAGSLGLGSATITFSCESAAGLASSSTIEITVIEDEVVIGTIRGVIRNSLDESPVAAIVRLLDSMGTEVAQFETAADGLFTFTADGGEGYQLTASAEDFEDAVYHDITITADTDRTLAPLYLVPVASPTGSAAGQIINALTGRGVEGLTLNARAGLNIIEGEIAQTTTSGMLGSYRFDELPAGQYTVEVVGAAIEGVTYTSTTFSIVVIGGEHRPNQNGSVTPELPEGEYRIVLSWGEHPRDLDSHLTGPTADGGSFHLYYPHNQRGRGSPWPEDVTLDLDDTSSYGPETTTILRLNPGAGLYVYTVHDFTNRRATDSDALANSNARVEVYRGNTLLITYHVPQNLRGTAWEVFELSADGALRERRTFREVQVTNDTGFPHYQQTVEGE